MKNITLRDMADVVATDLQPGMILAEGIVLSTELQHPTGGKSKGIVWIYTAADGHTGWADADQKVQVYGRLDASLTDALLKVTKTA